MRKLALATALLLGACAAPDGGDIWTYSAREECRSYGFTDKGPGWADCMLAVQNLYLQRSAAYGALGAAYMEQARPYSLGTTCTNLSGFITCQ